MSTVCIVKISKIRSVIFCVMTKNVITRGLIQKIKPRCDCCRSHYVEFAFS